MFYTSLTIFRGSADNSLTIGCEALSQHGDARLRPSLQNMKLHYSKMKRAGMLALAACTMGCAAFGQGPGGGPGGRHGGPGGDGPEGNGVPPPRRLPPIFKALDTNRDGILEADEITNAPRSLRTLEKSGSDQLTMPELLGPPPGGRHHGPPPGGGDSQDGPPPPPPDQSGTAAQAGDAPPPPPPPDESGSNAQAGPSPAQGEPAVGGRPADHGGPPGPGGRHHPAPPVIQALDENRDGVIESNEIDDAAQSLRTPGEGWEGSIDHV